MKTWSLVYDVINFSFVDCHSTSQSATLSIIMTSLEFHIILPPVSSKAHPYRLQRQCLFWHYWVLNMSFPLENIIDINWNTVSWENTPVIRDQASPFFAQRQISWEAKDWWVGVGLPQQHPEVAREREFGEKKIKKGLEEKAVSQEDFHIQTCN